MRKLEEIREVGLSVSRMSLPVLVEQAFIAVMGMVNTILAARLGRETISAIGMVDAINVLVISLFGALAVGGTVTVAQFTGRDDRENANATAVQAVLSSLTIAVAITLPAFLLRQPLLSLLYGAADPIILDLANQYMAIVVWSYLPIALVNTTFGVLRGAGDTRTPMLVSIVMNLVNVVFSLILIYGLTFELGGRTAGIPALGIRGAALGLLLARISGMILGLIPLLRGSKIIQLAHRRYYRWRPELLRCIFWLGIPASTEVLFFHLGKLVVQTFIVRLGTTVIAAVAIANSSASILMIPGTALSIAAMTLVGQQIGRRQPAEAKRQLLFLILAASVLIGVLSLLILPFLGGLIGLYTDDVAVIATTRSMVLSLLLVQPFFWASSFITAAGLRSAGDVRFTLSVSMASMGLLRIFLAYVFTVWLPLGGLGIWLSMYCDWVGRSVCFLLRLRGHKWHAHDLLAKNSCKTA